MENPNLISELYLGPTMPEVISRYADALIKTGKLKSIIHGNALINFNDNYVLDRLFLADLRNDIFNPLYYLIDKEMPKIPFRIEGRRKSLVKTEQKLCFYEKSNKSLDLLRDLLAFRIIILGTSPKDTMAQCYELLEMVLSHCISNGFIPCEVDDDNIPPTSQFKELLVPQKSLVPTIWKKCVKDYIYFYKNSGYQALHLVFRSAAGKCFEIQIKSIFNHLFAEGGKANHDGYNKSVYGELKIDREKVNIENYFFYNNELFDYVGVENALTILYRQKTF